MEATAIHDQRENCCRFVEQEFVEEEDTQVAWHDWAVESRIDNVMIVGHLRAAVSGSLSDWE